MGKKPRRQIPSVATVLPRIAPMAGAEISPSGVPMCCGRELTFEEYADSCIWNGWMLCEICGRRVYSSLKPYHHWPRLTS